MKLSLRSYISIAAITLAISTSPAIAKKGKKAKAEATAQVPQLILFGQENRAGQQRIVTGSQADLSILGADNFAYSLDASGRWEICMDTGFRAGCRIVEGFISNLGTDSRAISSARYVGNSVATAPSGQPASTPVSGPKAQAAQAYLYNTVIFGEIKPQLIINGFEGETSGNWTATQSVDELNQIYYEKGRYGVVSGAFVGQFSGNTFTGKYYEELVNEGLQGACQDKVNGTFYHGSLLIEFSPDRSSFRAKKNPCSEDTADTYFEWDGKLAGRAAPVVVQTGGRSVSGNGATASTGQNGAPRKETAADRIARTAAEAAEDEAKRKAEEKTRDAVRGVLGKVF
ncbi:hypothetical protein ACFOWX_01005 [Sphingorhabdus arenilitoris]|uniref:Beta/gamma crystallin 'Greek key' domain-containing protein n=1 Tax=Sphingorhabdus arenilitoris TaxID=1490041 RepID=A0ABV8RCK2_9SPHN